MKGQELDIEQYRLTEEPFYQEVNGGSRLGHGCREEPDAGHAQRPHRLRKDTLRAVHGLSIRSSLDHDCLPRRFDGFRPGRTLFAQGR